MLTKFDCGADKCIHQRWSAAICDQANLMTNEKIFMTITQTLDKVEMEMSTCDEPRPPNGPSPIATASGQR